MKRLLLKILIVCLAPLPFLYGLQWIVDKGLRKSQHHFYAEWNDVYNGTANADLLVMGSSRAWAHFSPAILDEDLKINSYNLGMNGWTFPMQKARFDIYLKHNREPKYVVQSVDLQMFNRGENLTVYQQFLPYLNEPEIQAATRSYRGEFGIAQYYLPLFKYNGNLDLAAFGFLNYFDMIKDARVSDKGYEGQQRIWDGTFEVFKQKFPNGYTFTIDERVVEEFRNYLDFCRRKNIKVVLVYSPEYYELRPFITNRVEIFAVFQKLSGEFDVPFLDYSNHPISSDRSYFYNSEHMNKNGAEAFTKILAQDLQNLGVR